MFGLNSKLDTDWLATLGFFEGFSGDDLKEVSRLGEKQEVPAGTVLIDQGRIGDTCYVVVEGRAGVYMGGEFVASVRSGSMVGEMALVEHRPRNASVVAEVDMVVVSFGIEEFRKLIDRSPTARDKVMGLLEARLAQNKARGQN